MLLILKICVNNFGKGEEYMNVKVIISFVLCLSLFGLLCVLPKQQNGVTTCDNEFLRIHIRANSNETV